MDNARQELAGWKKVAGIAAVIGILGSIAGYVMNHEQFSRSYIMAYDYWLGLGLGGLGWLMIIHLTSGRWGLVIQRPMEAAARTMPLLLVLFIPVVIGMHDLYEWTHKDVVAEDHLLQFKQPYLNTPGFLIRAAIYFGIWIVLAYALSRLSRKQDETGDADITRRLRVISAPGLVLFGLSATFASFDWLMSLEPHWFSSIYGALFMVGHGLGALAFIGIVTHVLARRKPLEGVITPQQFHDVGNLTFAFVILWTYMSFGQFLIIWSANLYEETMWYLDRRYGGWLIVSIILFILHFVVPFILLLMRNNKRISGRLVKIGLLILVVRYVDVYWQVAPTFREHAASLHWMDAATFLGVGGLWVLAFLRQLGQAAVLPKNDPRHTEFVKGGASH